MSAVAVERDVSTIPGAMERVKTRELPDGSLIEFEEAPRGWLTKRGEPRKKDHRAYHWTPAGGQRGRLPSTTTLLDAICPKPGVAPWSEKRGIEGLLLAIQSGAIDPARVTPEQAIESVKRLKLGADAAKKIAAVRGLNVHAINEHYMLTGEGPKLKDHPEHHRGYIRSWAKAMLKLDPQPVEVETLVVNPEQGYAGRLDLRAHVGGLLETIDYKTQQHGGIYPQAHYQVNLYERGAIYCGAEPASHRRVVVLPADGEWDIDRDTMVADHEDWRIDAALAHYRGIKPIEALCAARNRDLREARA
jgi:hypothetical protein